MVLAEKIEIESDEASDQEFIKQLAGELLIKANEARADHAKGLSALEARSGVALIDNLCAKLEVMQNSEIDLSRLDYTCLDRVLSMLIKRGEDYHQQLQKVVELKQKYEINQN